MTSLSQLLSVYMLGGLTFIPLVLAAILVPGWLALPKVENGGKGRQAKEEHQELGDDKLGETLQLLQDEQYGSDGEDGTVSGTFAVMRKYDLPAATLALSARSGGHNTGGTGNGTDAAVDVGGGSESVYQSMYRSVFDRTRAATPLNALSNTSDDESGGTTDPKTRRKAAKPAPANVFFIVLRHGHLMLYDSPAQIDVRHVISLAHHTVSMSDGDESDPMGEDIMTDGDLFIKRTAILLTPLAAVANGAKQAQAMPPKPFYLFTSTSIQKESFYHALLLASPSPPTPRALDPHDLIKLQTTLHSTLITPETRALNAFVSRIFLALSGTDQLKDFIRAKIEKKISRVQKPGFINALALQEIDLGTAAPVVANLRLKDLNISGDVVIACDVRYSGGISLALAAQARLDLGQRFKARTVDLLLSSSLKRFSGHMLIRIKPPPSNRLWFCFDGMPDMEIKIEPVVSSRQITYNFILRQIEERIRAVVAETLVKPNWDDISFFDTRSQKARGGIWADDGMGNADEINASAEAELLAVKGEKTMSMPALPHLDADAEGASSGTDTLRLDREAELKRRSVVSLPGQTSSAPHLATIDPEDRVPTAQNARPLRSPSLTSPSASAPSVALDDSSANFDPSHKPPPQRARTWGRRQMAPQSRKEAVDAVREVRDRSLHMLHGEGAGSGNDAFGDRGTASEDDDKDIATPDRTATGFSTASAASSASASTIGTSGSMKSESARQKRGANLLAAATTATTAAKNWSWNAIQNRAAKNVAGRRPDEGFSTSTTPHEPMGRGQPLPPPGTPLPGPHKEKSLWAGSGFGVPGLSGSLKRKPVLPKRPADQVHEDAGEGNESKDAAVADEFGEWAENSGYCGEDAEAPPAQEKKVPPALPKRRRAKSSAADAEQGDHENADSTANAALSAALLASSTNRSQPSSSQYTDSQPGQADLNTVAAHVHPSTTSAKTPSPDDSKIVNLVTFSHPDQPAALRARPVDPATIAATQAPHSNSDPEDLVVVAAPVESGRTTPLPAEAEEKTQQKLPQYDGDGWGNYDDDDDSDRYGYGGDGDDEEGMPKASFSRSRGGGEDLHL